MKMNWFNLKKNKCPKCNKDMMKGIQVSSVTQVIHHPCGFMISSERYQQIVSGMVSVDLEKLNREYESPTNKTN